MDAGIDCVFGLPGYGKSTLSLALLRRLQAASRGWALVGDTAGRFPRRGRDGRRFPWIVEHRTTAAAEEWLDGRELGRVRPAVHVVADPDQLSVAWLAERLAQATGRMAICWWDEVVFVDGVASGSGHQNKRRKLVAVTRHSRVHLGLCSQSPTWAHRDLRRLASRIHLLRLDDKSDLDSLRESGVPSSYLEACRNLPKYKRICYSR